MNNDNDNTLPSDKDVAIDPNNAEKPLDPEWVGLFAQYPDYENTFNNLCNSDSELGDKFKLDPKWARLFAGNKKWLDLFANNLEVGKLFANDLGTDLAENLFPYLKLVELFEIKSEQKLLIEKFKGDSLWINSLKKNKHWLKIFAHKPELFWNKQEWFEQIAKKLEETGGDKWILQFAEDKKWIELFDNNPEWALVYAFELDMVKENRKLRNSGLPIKNIEKESLVGLAFSGGGIRSASFGLGVLEALRDFRLLNKVDFLSTVSGGGYIGAWLSANCKRAAMKGIDWLTPSENEEDKKKLNKYWDESISHLRRYSNYLSPKVGLFSADTWTMATVWLRNTLLIQLTVILGIAALLLIPRLLFFMFELWPGVGDWRWAEIVLFIVGIAGIAGNNLRINRHKISSQDGDNWFFWFFLAIALLVIAILVGTKFKFDPSILKSYWSYPTDLSIAISIAFLLVLSGSFLLPGALKLVNTFCNTKYTINYTQGLVQWLVVIPVMAVGFFLAAILWEQSHFYSIWGWNSFGDFFKKAWTYWPFQLTVVFVSLFVLSFCCLNSAEEDAINEKGKSQNVKKSQENEKKLHQKAAYLVLLAKEKLPAQLKRLFRALILPVPAMIVLYALISGIMLLLHGWTILDEEGKWKAFVWAPSLILFSFSLAIVMLLGMLGRLSNEGVREWWSRFGAWLAIYGFAWMVIVAVAVYGPLLSAKLFYHGPWKELGSGWIGTTLAGLFAGKSASTDGTDSKGISAKLKEAIAKLAPFVFIAGLLIVVSMILHLVIAFNSIDNFTISPSTLLGDIEQPSKQLELKIDAKSDVHIDVSAAQANISKPSTEIPIPRYKDHWGLLSEADISVISWTFGFCLLCVAVLAWRVDINEFSFNAFYRSRLARCFLGATRQQNERHPQLFTGFDDDDDLPLSELKDSCGPLHIVNCALNLGGSSDLTLHTRHSAIYTLTPLFCGSRYMLKDKGVEIGYTPTAKYGGKSGQPKLGQAIAVSGAAASPNMGYHTSPVTAFLMTLFNVRLGWWFPNPHNPDIKSPSPLFSLRYLLMELFGLANERSDYLSISDGGHFENLAAYELVKRKCKVIIISDGECDPESQFEGLGTLIRMCEVDFGAKIKIDVRSIQPEKESSWSRRRCAVGKIIYDDESEGTLIYIKASMNGHEDTAILQYRAAHKEFPHETTGDQFYSEDQFESYRSLGRDITERTFAPVMWKIAPDTRLYNTEELYIKYSKEPDLIECAGKLQDIWSPVLPTIEQFSRHADRLMELWSEIREDESLISLDNQLTNEVYKSGNEKFRSEFYFCSELIQQMENVYLDLNLEETWGHPDNKGWRTLFIRWADSETFNKIWKMTDTNYGLRFRRFCERHLHLPFSEPPHKE